LHEAIMATNLTIAVYLYKKKKIYHLEAT